MGTRSEPKGRVAGQRFSLNPNELSVIKPDLRRSGFFFTHAALDFFGNQMRDDLGVRLGGEVGTPIGELFFKLQIVFDDAIVHHDHITGAVGMRIGFRRPAVGGPTSMTNAHRTRDGLAPEHRFEIAQFAFAAANRDMPSVSEAILRSPAE